MSQIEAPRERGLRERRDDLPMPHGPARGRAGLTTPDHPLRPADAVARSGLRRLALLGNHLPRHCGIATFTTDLGDALSLESPALETYVIAMNDPGERHAYADRVRFEIDEADFGGYRRAASFLNASGAELLSVQHEYGIFGGAAGDHVIEIYRGARMPIVTTLHTILAEPSAAQRRVMDEILSLSDRIVVMSERGARLLRDAHAVAEDKIDRIPHGIASVPAGSGAKARLGLAGRPVLLTYGLLSPDKGIEHVIDALPDVLGRFPGAVYLVVGATHPHVKAQHGEAYRGALTDRARSLGVAASVQFHDRFVPRDELGEFVAAADVYLTPYLNLEQITSGTLAFAVGNGRPVISTPYRYAQELLADGRGILVPRGDAAAIARELNALFADGARQAALAARAAEFGREMMWPSVARAYLRSFERALSGRAEQARAVFESTRLSQRTHELPALDLRHVATLTDGTGILQHADFATPSRDAGYCVDDNARALLLMTLVEDAGCDAGSLVRSLAARYLAFVSHAFDAERGRFRNFMSYARCWSEGAGSEDSHGRALWALGARVGRAREAGRSSLARRLFHAALPAVSRFSSPRAWAYALLGIAEYQRAFAGDRAVRAQQEALAKGLLALFERASSPQWPWFEDRLTYCNARLPQALLRSGEQLAAPEMVRVGVRSLAWLASQQRSERGDFAPIGSDGFFARGGARAPFDQQPIEACAMVSACVDASRVTREPFWPREARRAFDWFVGRNHLPTSLYDAETGGCRDGLHADRANENQGAESTLSFLLALTELRAWDRTSKAKRSQSVATN